MRWWPAVVVSCMAACCAVGCGRRTADVWPPRQEPLPAPTVVATVPPTPTATVEANPWPAGVSATTGPCPAAPEPKPTPPLPPKHAAAGPVVALSMAVASPDVEVGARLRIQLSNATDDKRIGDPIHAIVVLERPSGRTEHRDVRITDRRQGGGIVYCTPAASGGCPNGHVTVPVTMVPFREVDVLFFRAIEDVGKHRVSLYDPTGRAQAPAIEIDVTENRVDELLLPFSCAGRLRRGGAAIKSFEIGAHRQVRQKAYMAWFETEPSSAHAQPIVRVYVIPHESERRAQRTHEHLPLIASGDPGPKYGANVTTTIRPRERRIFAHWRSGTHVVHIDARYVHPDNLRPLVDRYRAAYP